MDNSLVPIGMLLLLIACLTAMLARRLGLPYIVGLVLAGFLIALLPISPEVPLSRELIFNFLLPPLVFEAALQLDWQRFKRELVVTLTLAFLGVAISAAVVATGMHYIVGWGWIGSGLFGVLIAATDPVSVIAAFREMKCEPRVSMVVEAESLLNDGVAAVAFVILAGVATGASPRSGGERQDLDGDVRPRGDLGQPVQLAAPGVGAEAAVGVGDLPAEHGFVDDRGQLEWLFSVVTGKHFLTSAADLDPPVDLDRQGPVGSGEDDAFQVVRGQEQGVDQRAVALQGSRSGLGLIRVA